MPTKKPTLKLLPTKLSPAEIPKILTGPATCRPGKPCAILGHALRETEVTKNGGAGLWTFVRFAVKPAPGEITAGVIYKPARKAQGFVINHCPWCGHDPTTRALAARKPAPRRRRS